MTQSHRRAFVVPTVFRLCLPRQLISHDAKFLVQKRSKTASSSRRTFTRVFATSSASTTLFENSTEMATTQDRIMGAFWGLFIGDALAMPAHWYYDTSALRRDFGTIRDYVNPSQYHPDSILWRSRIDGINSKGDFLGDQRQYYGQRGVHYHKVLKKGQNTLNLQVAKVLMRCIADQKAYDSDVFLNQYVKYMLNTPNKDTYAEVYHREFFANYSKDKPLRQCAGEEGHDTASIGGLVSITPLALFLSNGNPAVPDRICLEHLRLTHKSAKLERYATVLTTLLVDLIRGEEIEKAVASAAAKLGLKDLPKLAHSQDKVIGGVFGSACYIESSLPAVLYLATKYPHDIEGALIENTNAGGDNCHRGAVLGAILGAANGVNAIPKRWVDGLADRDTLSALIGSLAALSTSPSS
eukprot:CAMPEP_0184660274 /NCGR_PEP_ID=MMETSP0308-20130426/33250_1 /TAXON_ID=38269 /ORGANISM="Gloeochaete witrockiana, Strain SAG 46.84" /LENGTH=410 /DNA_ID=CAMNT_0027100741 /DNA_START=40 /DNA_END=1272 /DNA_ORIENTATION=-